LEAFICVINIANQDCVCYCGHIDSDRQSVSTNANLAEFTASRDSSEESACLCIIVIPVKGVVEANILILVARRCFAEEVAVNVSAKGDSFGEDEC